MMEQKKMKIGLVFSGGMAKGAYQAGFMKAFSEHISTNEVKMVSASSIGILNAYGYLTGKTDKLIDLWRNIHFENTGELIHSVWKEKYIDTVFNKIFLEDDILASPMYASICYLPFLHINYFKMQGNYHIKMRKLIRKAIGFPLVAGPPRFSRMQLSVDGGVIDNIPAYPLIGEDLDVILIMHFNPKYRPKKSWRQNHIIIDLDISAENKFRKESFNFDNYVLNKMVDSGYEYGNCICSKILRSGMNIDNIRSEGLRVHYEERERRLTSTSIDSWVSKANTLTQLLRIKCLCKKNLRCKYKAKIKSKKIQKSVCHKKTFSEIENREHLSVQLKK